VTAALIDGKAVAARLRRRLADEVAARVAGGRRAPALAVVLVGDDAASAVYVRNKVAACREVGVTSIEHRHGADYAEPALLDLVAALNADPAIDGILVQMPLPHHIDATRVIAAIAPAKDVDGFHPVNAGRLATGLPGLYPCTPVGCLRLLEATLGDLAGIEALVIGRSFTVGRPMAALLVGRSATVTIAHSRSRDLPALARRADVLVAAVGRPEMVRGDWLKPGATVIDVGINRVPKADWPGSEAGDTRLVGDVAFEEARAVAAHITPVPGGVGPMTVACLLENVLRAAA
jgi:methylenetetrahydrofolate dehydrogenase (NADP+)/methenyltetrahydrofolate cyclohydrolase